MSSSTMIAVVARRADKLYWNAVTIKIVFISVSMMCDTLFATSIVAGNLCAIAARVATDIRTTTTAIATAATDTTAGATARG